MIIVLQKSSRFLANAKKIVLPFFLLFLLSTQAVAAEQKTEKLEADTVQKSTVGVSVPDLAEISPVGGQACRPFKRS